MMELYIGSHLSTAGGWNALLERSHEEGGTAFAFFPRSPYGKRSKALDPAGAAAFGARLKAEGYGPLVVHAPYVYNLAGKDEAKRTFAIEALAEDIELLTAVGVTFDTCHVLDAGYDLVHDYDGVMRQLDEAIGLAEVKAIHVNDSQFGLGSHKDRHANIGQGQLGIPFFTRLVNDPTMAKLPMILETKEQTPTTHRDEIALLRGLVD